MFNRSTGSSSANMSISMAALRPRGARIGSSPGTPKTSVLEVLKAFGGAVGTISPGYTRNTLGSTYLRFEDVQELMHKSRTPAAYAGGHPYVRQIVEILSATSQAPRRDHGYAAFTLDPDVIAMNEVLRTIKPRPTSN